MPTINIDELCEPITVTVGGKTYTVDDISRETAMKMDELRGEDEEDRDNLEGLVTVMAEVLHADREDIAKLGMRRLILLVTHVMEAVNEELAGKAVPEAAVAE